MCENLSEAVIFVVIRVALAKLTSYLKTQLPFKKKEKCLSYYSDNLTNNYTQIYSSDDSLLLVNRNGYIRTLQAVLYNTVFNLQSEAKNLVKLYAKFHNSLGCLNKHLWQYK